MTTTQRQPRTGEGRRTSRGAFLVCTAGAIVAASIGAASTSAARAVLPAGGIAAAADDAASSIGSAPASIRWIASWASSQQIPEPRNALPIGTLRDATLREIVQLSVGGGSLRIRFSNAFGTAPLHIAAARIARPQSLESGAIDAATERRITFGGKADVTIPAGSDYLSDPVQAPVAPQSDVAVSFYLPRPPARQTGHPGSREISFVTHGDRVAAAMLPGAKRVAHWYFLSGVEVPASPHGASVVALGDSITDGHGSTQNGNDRWPDDLARRFAADPATRMLGVANAGIGGNRLLADGLGPSALARFDRDVLAAAGVRELIVLEGINDLGVATAGRALPPSSHREIVARITAAYAQLLARAHAQRIRVMGGTLTPDAGSAIYHPDAAAEADRQAVNRWIRAPGHFDAVADFDAAVRDPARPDHLLPQYDSGDHLHPSPAGYRSMARAIPLAFFAPTAAAASCAGHGSDRGTDPASALVFTPLQTSGIYARGEAAGWTVSIRAGSAPPPGAYTYVIRENDDTIIARGALDLSSGHARIETSLDRPAMLYATVDWEPANRSCAADETVRNLGAAIDPTGLEPTAPRPADFDAFWREKLAALKRVPIHPVLIRLPTRQAGVALYRVELDSLGSHVQGYLAMP
ncbi:MAG: GDSL-type esterase/lipase family protein, partial [Steroidobacteraceae bacterium]